MGQTRLAMPSHSVELGLELQISRVILVVDYEFLGGMVSIGLLVQDLIVNSWMAHELSLGLRIRLSCSYSLLNTLLVSALRKQFLRYACFAALPSHCYSLHYLRFTLYSLDCISNLSVHTFTSPQLTSLPSNTDQIAKLGTKRGSKW